MGHAAKVVMPTPNSLKVSPPSAKAVGQYRQSPQKPKSLGYARFALLLFLFVHTLAMYYLRPLFFDGLCTYLFQDGLYFVFFTIPIGFGFLVIWSISILWLRRLIRRSLAHSADRFLRYLRTLAILFLVVEICWLIVIVALLVLAWDNQRAYAWRMCFPNNHH